MELLVTPGKKPLRGWREVDWPVVRLGVAQAEPGRPLRRRLVGRVQLSWNSWGSLLAIPQQAGVQGQLSLPGETRGTNGPAQEVGGDGGEGRK